MFRFAYDLSGSSALIKPFYIPSATAIEEGEMVLFTPGTGIAVVAGTDFDDPALGVAVEPHDGATEGRQKGPEIKVSVSPTPVYALKPRKVITATGGSTTTFVDANILPATDNIFKGGKLQIVSCAADSTLNGRIVSIASSTGATGTLTLGETLPAALAAGDTAYLCPGPLAVGSFGWDLNSDGTDVNFETSGGEALQLVDVDVDNFTAFFTLRLHQFGDYPKAL